jgi:hypothetical protein
MEWTRTDCIPVAVVAAPTVACTTFYGRSSDSGFDWPGLWCCTSARKTWTANQRDWCDWLSSGTVAVAVVSFGRANNCGCCFDCHRWEHRATAAVPIGELAVDRPSTETPGEARIVVGRQSRRLIGDPSLEWFLFPQNFEIGVFVVS